MSHRDDAAVALFVLALVTSVIAGFAMPTAAKHGEENGNYTVNLPHPSDHYPRGENGYNASINHFAAGTQKQYADNNAPDGIEALNWVVIKNQDIDFSQCSSENTAAYGIDRGNNRSGTQTDVSLLRYMEASYFNKHSIQVNHYDGDEVAAPDDAPINVNPEDEIVAHQGHKSQGGACYGMPQEPGWYQIRGKLNGTNYQGQNVTLRSISHYFYICKCDSEQEARNTLGPPPSEGGSGGGGNASGGGGGNASDGGGGDGGDGGGGGNASDGGGGEPTPTATPEPSGDGGGGGDGQQSGGDGGSQGNDNQPTATPTAAQSSGGGGGGGGANQQQAPRRTATTEEIPTTPTIASGPGFGAALSLLALLAAALVAVRRR